MFPMRHGEMNIMKFSEGGSLKLS